MGRHRILRSAVMGTGGLALVLGAPQPSNGVLPGSPSTSPATQAAPPVHEISDIEAVAPDDVWAVGDTLAQGHTTTLAEHWDGTSWSVVPTPGSGFLTGVSAVSSDDVWAIGSTSFDPIALHWDGLSWSAVDTPRIKNQFAGLYDVHARDTDDAWATGYVTQRAVVEHWDGTEWVRHSFPHDLGTGHPEPHDVLSLADNDAWIVGEHYAAGGYSGMLAHWDGQEWSAVSQPRPPGRYVTWQLAGVSGDEADDLWAVGGYYSSVGWDFPLVDHWNGSRWSRIALDELPGQPKHAELSGTDARAIDDVWAVGRRSTGKGDYTLIEHWDGSSWKRVASPNPGDRGDHRLYAVTADSASDAWALGYGSSFDGAFLEHWDGRAWTLVQIP